MTLLEKIKSIYTELTNEDFSSRGTICLMDEGNGPYIYKWEHPTLQRPTDEQLAEIN
jgi:hypothetical protein